MHYLYPAKLPPYSFLFVFFEVRMLTIAHAPEDVFKHNSPPWAGAGRPGALCSRGFNRGLTILNR
jgi:hypothetical protein